MAYFDTEFKTFSKKRISQFDFRISQLPCEIKIHTIKIIIDPQGILKFQTALQSNYYV